MNSSLGEDERTSEPDTERVADVVQPSAVPQTARRDARSLVLGPGAMLLSSLLFASMGVLVKTAARGGIPAAESTFVRFAAGLMTVLVLAQRRVIPVRFQRRGLLLVWGHFVRVFAELF